MVLKVLIARRSLVRNFVAYFLQSFVETLQAKHGWVVLGDDVIRTASARNDLKAALGGKLPDVLAFFLLTKGKLDKWANSLRDGALPPATTTAYFAEDVHYAPERGALRKAAAVTDALVVRYLPPSLDMLGKAKPKFIVELPHGASHLFFEPNVAWARKRAQCLLSGYIHEDLYPLRYAAEGLLEDGNPLIAKRKHPGYGVKDTVKETRSYAQEIAEYKMALAGVGTVPGTDHPYIIGKTVEICAAGTVMVTHKMAVPYLQKLGMVEGKHYLATDPDHLCTFLCAWLRPDAAHAKAVDTKLKRIAAAGRAHVRAHAQVAHRAAEFDRILTKLHRKQQRESLGRSRKSRTRKSRTRQSRTRRSRARTRRSRTRKSRTRGSRARTRKSRARTQKSRARTRKSRTRHSRTRTRKSRNRRSKK